MIKPEVDLKYEAPAVPEATGTLQKGDRINPKQIREFFLTQTGAPSGIPETWQDQIVIANVGAFVYLYIYDFTFGGWRRLQF